ncbi:MAG: DUF4097 family beta strand repeat-containing protein [Balneolaceae bacterium]|nr:DUF4097 family beta strand repeat-containing protein [Balneolaceae bacterium]
MPRKSKCVIPWTAAGWLAVLLLVVSTPAFSYIDSPKTACPHGEKGPEESCIKADKPYMTKEFTLDGTGILKLFTLAGNIQVISVPDSRKVTVELYVDRGYAIWSNAKNIDNYRIIMLQRGNEIISSVEKKKRDTGFFSDKMSFSYKVYTPTSISTQLKTLAGKIEVNDLRGDHLIKSSGGKIQLTSMTGHIQTYTSGGSIEIQQCKGTVFARTDGGSIYIDDSAGELRLKSMGGNIISERTSGTFLAQVNGGDIKVQMISVNNGVNLETTAGDIYLELPRSGTFDLIAHGTSIHLERRNLFKGEYSKQYINGTLNGGGKPVNIETASGTITINLPQ